MSELSGVIPPATTPFDVNGDILFDAAQMQIDWLIRQGISGVAVGVVDRSVVPSDDLCKDISVLPMTLDDLIKIFNKEPEPGIINLLLTPGEAVEPLAFHLV